MKDLLLRTDRWLWRMDMVLICIAGLAVLVMMSVTFADVFMRYALNAPLRWAYDLITQYLLIGSFFFAFSYALRTNENVAVDFFSRKIPPSVHSALMCAGHAVAALIFIGVTWLTTLDTLEAWRNDEAFVGALVWPTWSAKIVIPLGALALVLRLVHRSLAYAASMGDPAFQQAAGLENNQLMALKEHP
ncbi:TRAP transporter small permease [Polaromonas sp. P1-6]|nr:TRAP transporter small permease [Polaromonas sp. P1-6]